MSERLHAIELDPQVVQNFADVFIPRWDRYAVQRPDGSYNQRKAPLSIDHVVAHLTNVHRGLQPLTLGAYALDVNSNAKWLCLDADSDQAWDDIWQLAKWLYEVDIPTYLETSRRGGHLWLFTPTLPAPDIRRFAMQLLVMTAIDSHTVEIYPKQDQLGEGPGSLVRLPLGFHRKSNRVHHFVDLAGQPLAPNVRDQITLLSQPERVSLAFIASVLGSIEPATTPPSPTPTFTKYHPSYGEPLSESLKRAISVFDFVSQYVQLDGRGRGLCPFHDDQHYSFAVHRAGNYWHCFAGCGGGSLIDFWMLWRAAHGQDGSFVATITDLASTILK